MTKTRLPQRFWAYITTQSLGAFNDNFYKMLLQLFAIALLGEAEAKEVISDATIVFTIPFVLFGPWAGYFADRYAKTQVMKVVKFAEIGVMIAGVVAFYVGSIPLLLGVLFLMATQSTFFGPAKYGYIPEATTKESVTLANSWVEMSTFLAVIVGMVVAGVLLDFHNQSVVTTSVYAIIIAVLGSLAVIMIKPLSAVGSRAKFPWNPLTSIVKDVLFLARQKNLFLAGLANSYFWFIGLMFQTNILLYGAELFPEGTTPDATLLALLPASMGIGIAMGSLLASRWSGKKVELGLVPLGGFGIAFSGILLFLIQDSYLATVIILLVGGACGGLYIVPLYAYLQFYARENEKGRVLASAGIINGLFMIFGAFLFWLLSVYWALSPALIFLILGCLTILAVVYICTVIPEYFIRFCFWLLTHTIYRVDIEGEENIPFKGAALLAPNHVSYIDSFFIGASMQRFIRFLMHKDYYELGPLKHFFNLMSAIPIDPSEGRESVAESLARARQALEADHVVCIYPEGKLTRDGELNEFRPGYQTVVKDLDCPIIPVYLENLWGSIFSWKDGKVIKKWPDKWYRPITVRFGDPLPSTTKPEDLQEIVRKLGEGE